MIDSTVQPRKTWVRVSAENKKYFEATVGDQGYIDDYVGLDTHGIYAIVVFDKKIEAVPLHFLEVIH